MKLKAVGQFEFSESFCNTPEEHIYYFFFPGYKGDLKPCSIQLEDVKESALDFLLKDKRFKIVSFFKNYGTVEEYIDDDEEFDSSHKERRESNNRTFFFSVKNSKLPCLIKVNFRGNNNRIINIISVDQEYMEEISKEISTVYLNSLKDYEKETRFGVLYSSNGNIIIKKFPLKDDNLKDINLELNYGKEFIEVDKSIINKIKNNTRGIFIFHGESGSGKSTYIKKLAKDFSGKRTFIFLPTMHLNDLLSPSILPVLINNPNSILVLEDAEKAVVSRENGMGNESLVSTLLNIGDGILGSMLNISIILTFNTKKESIDPALLRKGRLLYEYEFGKLSMEDSQKLLDNLKKEHKTHIEMSIAEIYNLDSTNNHKEKEVKSIGFGR